MFLGLFKKNYTVDSFIRMLERIPEERWSVGHITKINGRRCVLGHLGGYGTKKTLELEKLFRKNGFPHPVVVNDSITHGDNSTSSPKVRILNVLREIKEREAGDKAVEQVQGILSLPMKQLQEV